LRGFKVGNERIADEVDEPAERQSVELEFDGLFDRRFAGEQFDRGGVLMQCRRHIFDYLEFGIFEDFTFARGGFNLLPRQRAATNVGCDEVSGFEFVGFQNKRVDGTTAGHCRGRFLLFVFVREEMVWRFREFFDRRKRKRQVWRTLHFFLRLTMDNMPSPTNKNAIRKMIGDNTQNHDHEMWPVNFNAMNSSVNNSLKLIPVDFVFILFYLC
jgi:hypothetical protein